VRKLGGIVVVVALAALLAGPAAALAQLPLPLPPVPTPPAPPALPLPQLPVPIPDAPQIPLPPDATVDPSGIVSDPTGTVIGILDPVTGGVAPTVPSVPTLPAVPGTGSGGGTGSGSTGTAAGSGAGAAPGTTRRPAAAGATGGTSSTTARDTRAPKLTLRASKRTSAATARKRGVRVVARCDEACTVTVHVLRGGRVGALTKRLAAGHSTTLQVKLTAQARKAIASARRSSKLTVSATAVDAAGNRAKAVRRAASVTPPRRR
jgi:hypothetical protein